MMYLDATTPKVPATPRGDLSATALMGTEFTFTNQKMIDAAKEAHQGTISTQVSRDMQQQWINKVRSLIDPDVKVSEAESKRYKGEKVYTVRFADDWWYSMSLDPGVIETQTKPMTLEQAKGEAGVRIRKYVFDVAADLGLHADASFGGGHIHLDVASTFGTNEQLFGDFVADFENEALAMDAFEHDPVNAPRTAYARGPEAKTEKKDDKKEKPESDDADMRVRFATCIQDFRMHKTRDGLQAMRALAKEIQNYVHRSTDVKYSALNFQHMLRFEGFKTIEIRALRAQRTYDEFLMEAELFLKRIQYLETAEEKPTFNPKQAVANDPSVLEGEGKVISALTNYVKAAGLDPQPYEALALEYRKEFGEAIKRDTTTL